MKRAMIIVLLMTLGSLIYQRFLTETADYMVSFGLFYWSSMSAVTFWVFGLFKKDEAI